MIDDEPDMRAALRLFLKAKGHELLEAGNGGEALDILKKQRPDGVLLDLFLGKESGMPLLSQIKKIDSTLPVIVVTGYSDVPTAVEAMKLGAADYIAKPFKNEHLLLILQKAVKMSELVMEVKALRRQVKQKTQPVGMVFGPGPAIEAVIKQVHIVAPTDLSVIIQGPSGSGKEVLARLIHKFSRRVSGPFIAVDCGTLPEALVESELFGFEKGAFTGADRKKLGQFEMAFKGTFFLDEVGNLSPNVQAKLLRVLQERKIRHLGGKTDIQVNVRILAASNKNLAGLVEKKEFREDLYHRLNQFSITLPPLSQRREDIAALAAQFIREANRALHKKVQSISQAALTLLESYSWPGNIRELRNVIFRAVLLAEKSIEPEHIQLDSSSAKQSGGSAGLLGGNIVMADKDGSDPHSGAPDSSLSRQTLKEAVVPLEKEMIRKTLAETGGNKVRTAKLLGIDRKALYYKIKKHGL